jgi:copper chaperone CopZ
MKELILNVEGMHCQGCENRIQRAISLIDGVKEVEANHTNGTVIVKYEDKIDENEVKETISDLDFTIKE